MMNDVLTWKNKADSYYIRHPQESFAIFLINDAGDLMINSDWGCLFNAWRSFGSNFKEFLVDLDKGYWCTKMEYNLNMMRVPKAEIKRTVTHVWPIFQEFQKLLKHELAGNVIELKAPGL